VFGCPFVADATPAARVGGDPSFVDATLAAPVGGDGINASIKPPWVWYFTDCSAGVATTEIVSQDKCFFRILRVWCVCGNLMCSVTFDCAGFYCMMWRSFQQSYETISYEVIKATSIMKSTTGQLT